MTTIRMQNIPLDTHKRQLLRKCLNMNFPNWMTSDNLVQVFLGFSQEVVLSSSLELSPDNSKTMTGTITLRNMSEVQKLLEVDEFSLSEGNAFPVESTRRVAIDTHFHGLTVIAGGDDSKLDIIAIHGLNGHAFNSWTVDDGVMWLRDLLPAQVPDARVLLYGYNANVIEDASRSRIQEHARLFIKFLQGLAEIQKRRVIFICHSLGGLVLKQALVFIRNEKVYSTLRDVALGVIFLGTPHGGSAHADIAQDITRISFRANANQLLSDIKKDSASLMDLAYSFKEFHSELKIASFCEQLSMKLPGPFSTDLGMVVDQRSATIADEPPIPVNCDHVTIAKYANASDVVFQLVVREVKRMAMGIVTSMPL
ncbi:Alpha/Beta hydrolase protein [Russula earlei]|uniref:Alpha/Beta hydrolase protein n=1 Tax=Russula earlei TaxID=71964 RepID=A0ACC0TQN2_9AGAM|nr:Alpha/Beta hydrolase protein [Russula earlei]